MLMKVLVSDSLAEEGVKRLSSGADVDVITNLSPEELIEKIKDYDALVIRSGTKVTADVIRAADRLKVIGRAGVGIDNVDVEAATKRGIIVLNTPGGNTISAAEHTIAMMMALARNIPQANAALHKGEWNRKKYTGVEFFNKTLGVVGLGRVGAEVAARMKSFGMQILASAMRPTCIPPMLILPSPRTTQHGPMMLGRSSMMAITMSPSEGM
jgi:D-3-phosphoglycerate dehydrogenase